MSEETTLPPTTADFKKRNQNLLAIAIILGGLFVGSLFVDFVQLITGEGFSPWATRNHNVLTTADKTWVGYTDPKVELQVISDNDCSTCDPNEALVWLRRVVPTLEATRVDIKDNLGATLAERFSIVTLPAFIFSKDILHTNFYSQASSLFQAKDGRYFFDMTKIGLPAGRYLTLPHVGDDDIQSGPKDAKVTIVEYSDFECPYCQDFHKNLKLVTAEHRDQIRFVYKHLPLSFHAQANNAALASECANDQGKFDVYADYLFSKQAEWSKAPGLQKFKDYAWWLKLDHKTFVACLDKATYQDKINQDKDEAVSLQITATPTTFINDTFIDGAISLDDLKQVIEREIAR